MADALSRLRSRMPQTVQEREILRVVATVQGADPGLAMQKARREVLVWAQRRSGGQLPQEAWNGENFEFLAGGRTTLGTQFSDGANALWAIRGDDPDKTVAGRVWTTEVTLGRSAEESPQLSLRLMVSSSEAALSISPHVPGLLQQISERCGLSVGGIPLTIKAWRADREDDVYELIAMIESRSRTLPILLAAGDERAEDPTSPLLDVDDLARATLGLAHVVALPAPRTFALSDAFGKARSVYHGAARVYLAGFDAASDPYEHRLILGDAISSDPEKSVTELRRIAASESLRRTRLGHDVIAFAAVRSATLKIEQDKRANEGASDTEKIEIFQQRMIALESEVTAAKAEATQNFDLAASEEERAKVAEAQLHASRLRIQMLDAQLQARGLDLDDELVIPDSWDAFAEWCDQNFVGRCVLAPTARRGTRKPAFEDVELSGRCLRWLATICRDRRINGGGTLANIPIEEGIENAPCGSDTFEFEFQGRRLQADWHVKNGGNTRDPSRCLRIYYAFDEVSQQVVIAEMPAHRRTAAS